MLKRILEASAALVIALPVVSTIWWAAEKLIAEVYDGRLR